MNEEFTLQSAKIRQLESEKDTLTSKNRDGIFRI